jgi:hypothetical protein
MNRTVAIAEATQQAQQGMQANNGNLGGAPAGGNHGNAAAAAAGGKHELLVALPPALYEEVRKSAERAQTDEPILSLHKGGKDKKRRARRAFEADRIMILALVQEDNGDGVEPQNCTPANYKTVKRQIETAFAGKDWSWYPTHQVTVNNWFVDMRALKEEYGDFYVQECKRHPNLYNVDSKSRKLLETVLKKLNADAAGDGL